MAGIRVQLNQLREDLDECIQQQAFVKAAELKEKISELESEKAEISQAQLTHVEEVRIERVRCAGLQSVFVTSRRSHKATVVVVVDLFLYFILLWQ